MTIAHLRRIVSVSALLVALALPAGASLWSNEGMMIDSHGSTAPFGTPSLEEGMMIDPNG